MKVVDTSSGNSAEFHVDSPAAIQMDIVMTYVTQENLQVKELCAFPLV